MGFDKEKARYIPGEPVTLETAKAERIALSKQRLAEFLEANPLLSVVHGGEAALYNVTAEKQSLLTSALLMAQGALTAGIPYEVTWNAAGKPCEVWTVEELTKLAFEIAMYVKPFVAHQQALEVAILDCETVSEVRAVAIDYLQALES